MEKITLKQYNAIPEDYRGIIDTDGVRNDNLKLNGRRSFIKCEEGATVLLIEGLSFEIIEETK